LKSIAKTIEVVLARDFIIKKKIMVKKELRTYATLRIYMREVLKLEIPAFLKAAPRKPSKESMKKDSS